MNSNAAQIEKSKITQAFSRAAPTYAHEAVLQRSVADTLLAWLPDYLAKRVLDLGCGSGSQLAMLQERYPDAHLVGADISTEMLGQARVDAQAKADLIGADIDQLPFATNSIDVVFSSLAVQWCSDFRHALTEMQRVTKKGGYIALSTMASGSLAQLGHAWNNTDNYSHTNQYPEAAHYYDILSQSELDIVRFAHVSETLYFGSFRELLANLKRTGVTHISGKRRAGLLTPTQLKNIGNAYEKFRTDQGLPLRFQVIYCLTRV